MDFDCLVSAQCSLLDWYTKVLRETHLRAKVTKFIILFKSVFTYEMVVSFYVGVMTRL